MALHRSKLRLCLVLALISTHVYSSDSLQSLSRRRIFKNGLAGLSFVSSSFIVPNEHANAVQGAAEYDLEYYMRDLFKGNPKEGTQAASSAPPAPPPRNLSGPLLPLLLNSKCSAECMPAKALMEVAKCSQETLAEKVETVRSGASRSFQSRAPWKEESVTDQYYFELMSYALWRAAADLLPNFASRDTFAHNVGREIYKRLDLKVPVADSGAPLTKTLSSVKEILDLFTKTGYCKSYRLGDGTIPKAPLFDELDDQDLKDGLSVNALISVFEPATLGASLQITGEQSRFSPEFVGTTLAAMWESVGIKASYETYFVDPEYRPNPKDYFPNEQLLQFTLSKM